MKILVAMDGTEHSWKTLDKTLSIAKSYNADITVIGIVDIKTPMITTTPAGLMEKLAETVEATAHETLEKAKKYCKDKGASVKTMVEHGAAAETICEAAEKGNFDLLVIGNSGKGRLSEFFLGSISSRIAHVSKVDVLIVR